ncbi:hypothetical protein EDD85DRAFT_798677 [Armillaria nabsnona]|nr:hypothetical protein EDD85DRAFT_798677 [Armillaria nabsnona]
MTCPVEDGSLEGRNSTQAEVYSVSMSARDTETDESIGCQSVDGIEKVDWEKDTTMLSSFSVSDLRFPSFLKDRNTYSCQFGGPALPFLWYNVQWRGASIRLIGVASWVLHSAQYYWIQKKCNGLATSEEWSCPFKDSSISGKMKGSPTPAQPKLVTFTANRKYYHQEAESLCLEALATWLTYSIDIAGQGAFLGTVEEKTPSRQRTIHALPTRTRNKGPESKWIIILWGRSHEGKDVLVEYMEEPYIHEYGTILLQLYTVDGSIVIKRQNNEISATTSTPNLHGHLHQTNRNWTWTHPGVTFIEDNHSISESESPGKRRHTSKEFEENDARTTNTTGLMSLLYDFWTSKSDARIGLRRFPSVVNTYLHVPNYIPGRGAEPPTATDLGSSCLNQAGPFVERKSTSYSQSLERQAAFRRKINPTEQGTEEDRVTLSAVLVLVSYSRDFKRQRIQIWYKKKL